MWPHAVTGPDDGLLRRGERHSKTLYQAARALPKKGSLANKPSKPRKALGEGCELRVEA